MNNTTTWKSASKVKRDWYELDATGMPLGRLASLAAKYLMGKTSPEYSPNLDMGHNLVIVNADKVIFTGKKKSYMDIRHYTGYPGGLRIEKVSELMKTNPLKVVHTAIKGMLPKSRHQDSYLSRLHMYTEATHPHTAQKPVKIKVSK